MAKCIPNVYGKADRELLDCIEAEMHKNMNGNILPEFWQVGATICTRFTNGYYHVYSLERDPFNGKILRDYRIDRKGKMVETDNYYSVPTKEDFFKWCADRNVNFKEE
jgi:hypothetical protein